MPKFNTSCACTANCNTNEKQCFEVFNDPFEKNFFRMK